MWSSYSTEIQSLVERLRLHVEEDVSVTLGRVLADNPFTARKDEDVDNADRIMMCLH